MFSSTLPLSLSANIFQSLGLNERSVRSVCALCRVFPGNMTKHSWFCVMVFIGNSAGSGIILSEAVRESLVCSLARVGCRWGRWAVLGGWWLNGVARGWGAYGCGWGGMQVAWLLGRGVYGEDVMVKWEPSAGGLRGGAGIIGTCRVK